MVVVSNEEELFNGCEGSNGDDVLVLVVRGEERLLVCIEEWPVLSLLLAQEFVVSGGEERLLAEWDVGSLAIVLVACEGGGEACPFKMFMRWWRRHLARLLENQT